MMIPVASGLVHWGLLGVVLTMLCVLGGLWRLLALQGLFLAGSGSILTRGWLAIAALGTLAGLAGFAGRVSGPGTTLAEWSNPADMAWRGCTLLELALAFVWIGMGSVERGSRWMLLLLGVGALATVAGVASQAMLAQKGESLQDQPAVVMLLTLLALGGGVAGPAVAADGCGRLLHSMSGETLDEETEIDSVD